MEEYYFYTEGLTVGYHGVPLIKNIKISLKKGEILTLIGPNGAGKTTILRSIIKQLKPLGGVVVLDGKETEQISGKELSRKLSVVLTERVRPEMMTCKEVVATGRYPYTGKFGVLSKEDWKLVDEAMELVHIHELADRDFSKTSDGQKQRVMLARAICQQPDIIILDETSMVGAQLFYDLIQAIETGKRFIMIGDDGQLESIGMCNIFKDMLASKVVPVARLTKIHRQAAKSAIITESIKVRNATQLVPYGWAGSEIRGDLRDLELDIYKDASESFNHIINQYRTLYNKVGNDSAKIQIVLPQKLRGSICTYEVNNAIQEIVNPSRGQAEAKVTIYGDGKDRVYTLREGDQVIIKKNNYELHTYNLKTKKKEEKCPVFNGNRGIIRKIESSFILVDFDQWGTIFIPHYFGGNNIWATLELAYALSCHKLQDAVIVILAHAITQNPKVMQVHPVGCNVSDFTEQQRSSVKVVSAMVVVMQHQLALVIDVEILVFFIFLCIAVEEWNVFQTVPINISSWLHNIFFEYAT